MRIDVKTSLFAVIVTAIGASVATSSALAGPPGSMGKGENIVVSLQTSPFLNAEPACVGIQIATNLLSDVGGQATPASSVTLFVTLQGVDAVSPRMELPDPQPVELYCTAGAEDKVLPEVINDFVNAGGKILVCPLCWNTRYRGEQPLFGAEVGDPVTVHNLFLQADKVIDF